MSSSDDLLKAIEFQTNTIAGRLKELESALLKDDPEYRTHLAAIHKAVREQEELVHILSDAQLAVIFDGLKKFTGASLIKEMVEKPTRRKSKPTADDL